MKLYSKILLLIVISFSFFNIVNSGWKDIFDTHPDRIPYCQNDECGLDEGVKEVGEHAEGMDLVVNRSASEYIQDVVKYLLGFIYLISVILIIYAGFNLLTGMGDEEKAKKSKTMIIYIIVGIMIIFLAGPIIEFVLKILNN